MQALELLLDADTDDAVRREWATLGRAGLPNRADHTGASNAPNVNAARHRSPPRHRRGLGAALKGVLPLELHLGPVVAFAGRRLVLARLVVADPALLALHAAVVQASRATPSPHTTTGRWVPHVTLARGIPMDELGAALSLLQSPGVDGAATRVRRWDSVAKQTHPIPC